MVDRSKRRTLKIAASAGASAMAIGSLPVIGSPVPVNTKTADTAQSQARGAFRIQLITGRATPEDSVIFINQTGKDVTIKNFLPGIVTQNNQMIDLNSLLTNGDIVLKHGYPLATKAARWELLSLGPKHSYPAQAGSGLCLLPHTTLKTACLHSHE